MADEWINEWTSENVWGVHTMCLILIFSHMHATLLISLVYLLLIADTQFETGRRMKSKSMNEWQMNRLMNEKVKMFGVPRLWVSFSFLHGTL